MLERLPSRTTRLRKASAEQGVRCGLAPNVRNTSAQAAKCDSPQLGKPALKDLQASARASAATAGRVIGAALTVMLTARKPGAISAILWSRSGQTDDINTPPLPTAKISNVVIHPGFAKGSQVLYLGLKH